MDTKTKSMSISITPLKGKIAVSWNFQTFTKQQEGGKIFCYIPVFDLYFSASNEKMIGEKGKIMTKLYFDEFFIYNRANALKSLSLDLRKKGFKADRDIHVMSNFVKNKPVKAKFESLNSEINIPFDINESFKVQENQMELAF